MARVTDPFISALILVLAGYLFFDRAFAWLHIPGTPLFIGEAVLGNRADDSNLVTELRDIHPPQSIHPASRSVHALGLWR